MVHCITDTDTDTDTARVVIDPANLGDRALRCRYAAERCSAHTESGEDMSSVSSSRSGDIVYLALRGELDTANIDELRDTAQQAVHAPGVKHVVVDLQQVTFMGGTALGLLVGLRNDTTRRAITLTLRDVTPDRRGYSPSPASTRSSPSPASTRSSPSTNA